MTDDTSVPPVTILYVEDNDDLRVTIGELLQRPDRNLALCASAEDALGADRKRRFDIVVTDVSLPGMSGVDLARQLLGTDSMRRIVLCSGYELGEHILRLGPNIRTLTKPFTRRSRVRLRKVSNMRATSLGSRWSRCRLSPTPTAGE